MAVYKDLWRCSVGDVLLNLAQIIVQNSFLLCNKNQTFSWIFTVLTKAQNLLSPPIKDENR